MTNEERDKAIRILQWLHDNKFLFRSTEEDVKYATENAIKALEQEPCEDAISRQALLDDFGFSEKTRKWGGDHSGYNTMMLYEIQDMIESQPSVKPQSCEDVISRDAVLEKAVYTETEEGWCGYTVDVDYIKSLPSVNPQKWIPVNERLPEKKMRCLVAVGKFNLTQTAIYSDLMGTINHKIFYQGDYGHEDFMNITEYVKAWMPLPQPYRAESEDKE